MANEQSGKSKSIIHISILLAVGLCIGIYLISTTVLIAKDGITFIEYAKNLESAPVKTMQDERQHPGAAVEGIGDHRRQIMTARDQPKTTPQFDQFACPKQFVSAPATCWLHALLPRQDHRAVHPRRHGAL